MFHSLFIHIHCSPFHSFCIRERESLFRGEFESEFFIVIDSYLASNSKVLNTHLPNSLQSFELFVDLWRPSCLFFIFYFKEQQYIWNLYKPHFLYFHVWWFFGQIFACQGTWRSIRQSERAMTGGSRPSITTQSMSLRGLWLCTRKVLFFVHLAFWF